MSVNYTKYAPEFEVLLNGRADAMFRQNIISISVAENLKEAAEFSFTVNDQFDVDKQQFVWFDSKSLQPGNKLSIKMGYAESLVEILREGIIENITTTGFTQAGSPQMTISGYDSSKKWLNQQPSLGDNTTNQEITGSKLIAIIEAKFGLKKIVEDTKEIPTRITQNPTQTYGNILADQAKNIGWTFFVSRGTIYYINPRANRKAALSFKWGKDLISLTPTINASQVSSGVRVRSPSRTSREAIVAEATQSSEEQWENGTSASDIASRMGQETREEIFPCSTQEEAEIRARAALNNQGDNLLNCGGTIVGNPDLEIGQMIQLDGLGNRFSGKYFVTHVRNQISQNGYLTTFSVRKNSIKEI